VIRLEGISRIYQVGARPVHALRRIDEVVTAGEHVAIMGASGSGKSTLLNLIGCLDRPTAGRYWLEDREVGLLGDSERTLIRRHRIGFVFQSFHLVARLTAVENVELPMTFGGVGPRDRRRRAQEALAAVGLAERADHLPDQLSGGERQRVAIARATVMDPAILLADEPTGNLDTRSGGAILDLLQRLNDGGLTLVVVTHDPAVAQRADRVIVLRDGRVVARAPATDVGRVLSEILGAESPAADAPAQDDK
jgi:putative ABC transport system ATP-binding protein